MSSDQPRRRESSGSPGSPMGSTAAIIIAIVAVVAGFLILRQIRDDDDDAGSLSAGTTRGRRDHAAPDAGSTLAPVDHRPAVTTSPPSFTPTTEGATVVVANASTVNGAAGVLTTALSGKGFTMARPPTPPPSRTSARCCTTPPIPKRWSVATSIAVLLGGVEVLESSARPPPIEGGAHARRRVDHRHARQRQGQP